ncbi:MAG: CoA transferase [Acidimicrobiales bacterium]|nr:CoA transferase [Acidimicrobiales bacterium]
MTPTPEATTPPPPNRVISLLHPYRVIELGDRRSAFAGAMLAELGAEVILVEPPDGGPADAPHTARYGAPFTAGRGGGAGPEDSLVHHTLNAGKASVVLDLTDPADRDRLRALIATADAVIDAGGPTERAAALHPDTDELAVWNPAAVHLVVSGYGTTGPKADWADSDLVAAAGGAQLAITGNADKPPLRCAVPQVYAHACVDGVIGVLAAWAERDRSGLGQLVDVAAQHSWLPAAFHYALYGVWGYPNVERNGSHVRIGGIASRFEFPAKDGSITLTFLFGSAVGPFTNRLVAWMHEEGACDDEFGTVDFTTWDAAGDPARYDRLAAQLVNFTSSKTKAELLEAARARRLLIAPVFTLDEVLDAEQFHDRGFWRASGLARADGSDRPVLRPGPPAKLSTLGGAPLGLRPPGPAPVLGSSRVEDLIAGRAATDRSVRSVPAAGAAQAVRPLEGLKVLDCTISFAGPTIGRYLADLGATVVKIESQKRPDLARNAGPFLGGFSYDTSACFAHYNAGKLGIALDLSKAESRPVLEDLVAWADVLVESFAPGALSRLGLTDARLAALNPTLIALSSAMVGQSGPFSELAGYGNMASALCGFASTTAWADRPPAGPMGAYTDIISPRFATSVLLAALDHRRRTGEGLRIDFGQGESCLHLLALGLIDRQVNGGCWEGRGNDDVQWAPHGVYPLAGEDEWVAVASRTDAEWRSLAGIVGRADLAGLATDQRLARREELDRAVAAWTATQDPSTVSATLQAAGICAHTVQNSNRLVDDEQLAARDWLVHVEHGRIGALPVGANPVRLGRSAIEPRRAGPCLGEHTFEILSDLLGYDGDRIAELAVAEVLE